MYIRAIISPSRTVRTQSVTRNMEEDDSTPMEYVPSSSKSTVTGAAPSNSMATAAAISSGHCAALYGLECLSSEIQNNSNNHTRFICISRKPEIYPGADRTSLMLALPNRPGALYQLLGRFYAQGINLTKLESRPVPGRDFEFMFCFDIDASVYSPSFARLIEELDVILEKCAYLGSYSELA